MDWRVGWMAKYCPTIYQMLASIVPNRHKIEHIAKYDPNVYQIWSKHPPNNPTCPPNKIKNWPNIGPNLAQARPSTVFCYSGSGPQIFHKNIYFLGGILDTYGQKPWPVCRRKLRFDAGECLLTKLVQTEPRGPNTAKQHRTQMWETRVLPLRYFC